MAISSGPRLDKKGEACKSPKHAGCPLGLSGGHKDHARIIRRTNDTNKTLPPICVGARASRRPPAPLDHYHNNGPACELQELKEYYRRLGQLSFRLCSLTKPVGAWTLAGICRRRHVEGGLGYHLLASLHSLYR